MQDQQLFQAAADDILAGYDFRDSTVEATSGWTTKAQVDGGVVMECPVFLGSDGGSRVADLRVIINPDYSIDDAYAQDRESGHRVGNPVFFGHENTALQIYLHGAGSGWGKDGEAFVRETIEGRADTLFRIEQNAWQCWDVKAPGGEAFSQ